jgi:hypothetical protein
MVATRRGAKAPEVAPAPTNTLNAPPKRGGRKKAAVEEATEPAPATAKPTRTIAAKRKAKAEPEDAEQPMAKKTVATRAARSIKVATKAEPAPAAPKRATRGRKAEESAAVEEPEVIEEAPKPAPARTRKIAAVKKAAPKSAPTPAPKVEKPAIVEEPVIEEAPKPATRTRKAPAKKATTAKKVELPVIDKAVAAEPVKPALRGRKAAVPKAAAPTPVLAPRATRGRNAPAVPQDSPLKAPARKPAKTAAGLSKAGVVPIPIDSFEVADPELEPVEKPEPIEEPAPIEEAAQIEEPASAEEPEIVENSTPIEESTTVEEAVTAVMSKQVQMPETNEESMPVEEPEPVEMSELPAVAMSAPIEEAAPVDQPTPVKEPASAEKPEQVEEPFAEFPGYPTTPSHINAPITSNKAMAELAGYPTTPAHIIAPMSNKDAFAELAGYPKTPAHIAAPISSKEVLAEMPGYPSTPAHIVAPTAEAYEYNDIEMVDAEDDILVEHEEVVMPEEVEPLQVPLSDEACAPETPAQAATEALARSPVEPSTPAQATTPYPVTPVVESADEMSTPPTDIVWGVTDQEAFEELPAAYPNTPAHITAPITPRRALRELPDYPTTPSLALEAAIQEEISASVKKQTPSPQHFACLSGVPDELAETSEITEISEITETREVTEVTFADIGEKAPLAAAIPSLQLAPLKLAPTLVAPEPASPKKSALRSPQKMDAKTPKKAVTWTDHHVDESELSLYDGMGQHFLRGMVFYVDVTRNGRDQNFLFSSLLEELGAKVAKDLSDRTLTHVLFKDGDMATLEKCYASKGVIKCVNVGWIIDSDAKKERMDEEHYLVDVSVAKPATPLPTVAAKPFTPFKTPSKYALPPSSQCKMPSTPTSSEFERSFNHDEKENCEVGAFFDDVMDRSPLAPRTVPNKKSFLFGRSPMKTPSRPNFLATTPAKHSLSAIKPIPQAVTTGKKFSAEPSFFNSSLGPPKKLRLF